MPYIYKIRNKITNELYIGKTIYQDINRRWNQHKMNSNNDYYQKYRLYKDMNEYGVDNFEISEVEMVDDYNILSEREKYWINYFDTYKNGYNNTLGGDGELLYDYDEIWKLWEDGYKIKMISKVIGCNDFVVRTVLDLHNVSTEDRISRSYDDQVNSYKPFQRGVEQLEISTNNIVAVYQSVSEAARTIGCDNSYLSKVCKKFGITHGFKWRYSDHDYAKKDFSSHRVGKVDLKTKEIVDVYSSISEAAKSVNGDNSYISKVCRGIQKSSKGFGWIFVD